MALKLMETSYEMIEFGSNIYHLERIALVRSTPMTQFTPNSSICNDGEVPSRE